MGGAGNVGFSSVFPAYAGMSPRIIARPDDDAGFPRLRGDEP